MRQRSNRRSPILQLGLEVLENRWVPSCVVAATDLDGNGSTDLQVLGDAAIQKVVIQDSGLDAVLWLDCNGDGDFIDPGEVNGTHYGPIETFDVRLFDNNDTFAFTLTADYSSVSKAIVTDLGTALGKNVFTFNTAGFAIQDSSSVLIDVTGGAQNDFTTLQFDQVISSAVVIQENLLGGNETALVNNLVTASSVTFNGPIDTASVDLVADLGTGDNNFRVRFAGPIGTLGPAFINVEVYGSDTSTEVDTVTTSFAGVVDTGSTVHADVRLLNGNDIFRGNFPLDTFAIKNTNAARAGGAVSLTVDGGEGNDSLTVTRNGTTGPANLDGTLDIALYGGLGADVIVVDFGGTGAFQSLVDMAYNRNFRLRVYGGAGSDQITATLTNNIAATFNYDVQILGGAGVDKIVFTGNKNGGVPRFNYSANPLGPFGFVLLDGGIGADTCTVAGDFPVKKRNL